jgi:hypothetical protein
MRSFQFVRKAVCILIKERTTNGRPQISDSNEFLLSAEIVIVIVIVSAGRRHHIELFG